MKLGFHKMRGISRLAEDLLACQDGLRLMVLVNFISYSTYCSTRVMYGILKESHNQRVVKYVSLKCKLPIRN
jgi:hypothetical protein